MMRSKIGNFLVALAAQRLLERAEKCLRRLRYNASIVLLQLLQPLLQLYYYRIVYRPKKECIGIGDNGIGV